MVAPTALYCTGAALRAGRDAVPAGHDRAESIVGYTSKEAVKGKFLIVGAQFDAVKGGRAINDLVSGVQGVDYDDNDVWMTTAAQIQVPSTSGYTTYRYLNDGWYNDGSEEGATKAGWCDGSGNIVTDELDSMVAFWFKSVPGDATATIAGAVPSTKDTADVDCPMNFALRANAFPKAVALNSDDMQAIGITGVDYDDADAWMTTAPQIQVPSASGYTTYRYLNDGWYDDGSEEGATKAGWCDGSGNIVNDVIPAGQGFWTKGTTGAFKLLFTK